MPFVKKIETGFGIIGIWKLSDSLNDLISNFQFSEKEKVEFDKRKFDKRKLEYLSTRILLSELLGTKDEIRYQKSGKPELVNSATHISISHSAEFVVIFLSKNKVGIDIENTERDIEKLAFRFLHPKELQDIQTKKNKQLAYTLYWSAKEAIFKCTQKQGIQFNSQIIIPPFNICGNGDFTATCTLGLIKTNYKMAYFFHENNVVVYCVE